MKKTAAVVDFGTSKIVTLVAESGSYHRCDIIGAGTVSYDGFMDGEWNAPGLVSQAIHDSVAEAEAQSHRRIKEVYVGVPGEFSRVYVIETQVQLQGADPRVTPADVERVFIQATEEVQPLRGAIIHRSPAWFMVDEGKKTMEPVDMKGSTLRAMVSFIVADQFFLNDVSNRMAQMGLTVKGFYSTPMGEALLFLTPEDRDRTAVLVDVGYLSTEVMAVEGDALIFHKVLPVGGAHITLDLVTGLEAPMAQCEQIKRSYVFNINADEKQEAIAENGQSETFSHEQVARVLEPRVDEIAEMIQECIDHSGVRLGSWSNIYLTGGGIAPMNGGRVYLSNQLGRAVRQPAAKTAKLNSPIYSSALGLVDLVFETIETSEEEGSVVGKISSFFQNLLGK
ncbi:cell division FtsA domain-containing protein [Beduinella massiliensis]|uniref:cell division FtsA domain-containing protein n=1 Tax=Beduinella massiliensis TaxID=1852363 RepID=UPI000C84C852